MKKIILPLTLIVLAGGGGFWYWHRAANAPVTLRTAAIERGGLLATINATGTVEPEEVVDVGAQVAGMITSLGQNPRDPSKFIDYGTPVDQNTVLARIDDAIYQSQADQAQAQLEQAEAQLASAQAQVGQAEAAVVRADADIQQMQAKLFQADRDLHRAQELQQTKGAISDADYDAAVSAGKTAKANVAVGEAAITQARAGVVDAKAAVTKARAGVSDAKANLKRVKINLDYCTIKSPVKGVIIDRRVNVGQTVVSSLNAPSLFLIAKDLKRIQVWVSVNEADIGQIHPGQAVSFTVDAFPKEVFRGEVTKVRLNATMTQNVVTFTVEVTTDNSNGKLLPYLTANVHFEVAKRSDVLLVSNSALRWWPQAEQVFPEARGDLSKSPRTPGGAGGPAPAEAAKGKSREQGTLWVPDGKFVRPIHVQTGLSDGVRTEIQTEELLEGADVVIGEVRQEKGGEAKNPFTPQMFGGRKQQQ